MSAVHPTGLGGHETPGMNRSAAAGDSPCGSSNDAPQELLGNLPYELAFRCLVRVPWVAHSCMRMVCREWRNLLQSQKFHDARLLGPSVKSWICVLIRDSTTHTSSWWAFDFENGKWFPLPAMPNEQRLAVGSECRVVNGKLYVCGGYQGKTLDNVTVLDPTLNKWLDAPQMLSPRSHFVSGVIGERLYIAGGVDGKQSRSQSAECYDAKDDRWYWLPSLETGISFCLGVTINDNFFVQARGGEPKETLVFSPNFNLWSRLNTRMLCQPIIPHSVLDGLLYNACIVAGQYVIKRYNNESDSWTTLTAYGCVHIGSGSAGTVVGLVAANGNLWAIRENMELVKIMVDRATTAAYVFCVPVTCTSVHSKIRVSTCHVLWA